ncbi:hypothetical protein JTE90_009722 [Oedothorax gibbosus]|uniref:VWA N-terminal domain-containing protein n=1 Tax=Oedothorax gibbosus TaxID=931172 RepID=A0AAV6V9B3_9ARAC|nr:hypothetical protein JTE90_009722 [Oedothorax gibbosus]
MALKIFTISILALVLTNFNLSTAYDGFPSKEEISKWVELLQNSLLLDLDKYTGIKKLEKTYDDLRRAKLHKIDGPSLVHKMSSDITKYLEKKMGALEKLAEAAEKTIETYKFDPNINFTVQKFLNMKNFTDDDSRLVYSEKFNKPVNFSYSGVHIPVEIYEESIEILNGLNWTSSLDEVFRENAEEDPLIMQQYFGSYSGFMRTYPASKWIVLPQKPGFPDLYDVRLQPWYVHASSSPKDMLILNGMHYMF